VVPGKVPRGKIPISREVHSYTVKRLAAGERKLGKGKRELKVTLKAKRGSRRQGEKKIPLAIGREPEEIRT